MLAFPASASAQTACAADTDSIDLGVLLERWGPCPVGNPGAIPFRQVSLAVDSGDRTGVGAGAEPVYSEVVTASDAAWIRVIFNPTATFLKGPDLRFYDAA